MRVLILGSDYIWSIERHYLKYLSALGVNVSLLPAQNYLYEFLNQSIVNRILHRLGAKEIYKFINKKVLERAEEFQPDVLLVFKGMEIFPATLISLKRKGIKLANYNPDNPFIFTGRGSGNKNVTESISLFDLHFTYSLDIIARFAKEQKKFKVEWIPFGCEVPQEFQISSESGNFIDEEEVAVSFIGNPDKDRASFIQSMLNKGVAIDIFGNNWHRYIKHRNALLHPPIYGDNLWKMLRKYRVQLNLLRVHNTNSHNMRTFEIPGVGGIQLAPATKEHKIFFEDNKNIFLYEGAADAVEKIHFLKSLTKAQSLAIRKDALDRVNDSGYRYSDRASQVLEVLKSL